MELKDKYAQLCKEYIDAFCEKQDMVFSEEVYTDYYLVFNDFYIIDIETVRYDIDNNIKKGVIKHWYNYNASNLQNTYVNYNSYIMGVHKINQVQID